VLNIWHEVTVERIGSYQKVGGGTLLNMWCCRWCTEEVELLYTFWGAEDCAIAYGGAYPW
jgi:hypothetical protein